MTLQLYNTKTKQIEPFAPLQPPLVKMYSCGPTVYNYAHIGNFRAYLVADLLKRYLTLKGYKVYHVMNITDIDDKTIRDSQKEGKSLAAFTQFYTQAFFEDIETLNIKKADMYPKATEHIPEMIALISALQKNGHTYQHEHSVYFKITTFPQYGDLANLDVTQLKTNAQGRLAVDEYQKEDVRDFALWKAWTPEDGPVAYDSPFGKGRPGWHIECSAMSMKYLGEVFDIHTGGVDLIFPHHTNEIAQSVGATKKPFVRYWVHNEHLLVEGKKMAKSAGNFYTLRDLLAKGYDPKAIRYLLLATHYRQKLNFSFAGLEAASGAVARLQELVDKLKAKQETQTALCGNKKEGSDKQRNETSNPETAQPLVIALAASLKERFCQAMDNDLMIADALAALFDTVKECNRNLEYYTAADARHLLAVLEELNTVLEVLDTTTESIPQEIQTLAELRQRARKAKDWKTADALREKIAAQGYHLADAPDGSYLLKKIK